MLELAGRATEGLMILRGSCVVVLVGRSIQGVGGGGIIALTEIVVTDMVPLRERAKYLSAFSAMWSVGTVVGPPLGMCFFFLSAV